MKSFFGRVNFKYTIGILALSAAVLALIWWQFISVKPYQISQTEIQDIYQKHADYAPEILFEEIKPGQYTISFTSYDGDKVEGRLELPEEKSLQQWLSEHDTGVNEIFLGVSAMGRNYLRWWQDSFKGRPTITQVNKIGEMALASNKILVAIDARYHGTRKSEALPLSKIMNNLNLWGKRSDYENMVLGTIMDYKHLINSLEATFGKTNITLAGYSMGAQVSLILGATDKRINNILAIVPPNVDNKVAKVAPINFINMLDEQRVWLLTANGDEYADNSENLNLFANINSPNKKHLSFNSGHILPEEYTDKLLPWFEN